MPRVTLGYLQEQLHARDAEIAQLEARVREMREERAATFAALRIMHSLIDDALSHDRSRMPRG